MHHYEICFRFDNGALAAKISADARCDQDAKILAHALKEREHKALEVWDAERLVYERAARH